MIKNLQLRLNPQTAADRLRLQIAISTQLGIDVNRIKRVDIVKRSIDARQRNVVINLAVNAHIDQIEAEDNIIHPVEYHELPADAPDAVVV